MQQKLTRNLHAHSFCATTMALPLPASCAVTSYNHVVNLWGVAFGSILSPSSSYTMTKRTTELFVMPLVTWLALQMHCMITWHCLFLCHYHGIATSRILCRNILQPCCQLMGCCIWFHTLPFLLLHHDKEDYGIVCDAPCDMASLTNALHDNIVKLYNIFSHFVTHVNNTYMEVCVCCIEKATIFKSLKACN